MIAGVLVVPSPPMILPDYVGIEDPAGPLRRRCVAALRTMLERMDAGPDTVVIVTGAEPAGGTSRPPLGVRIGEHLLALAGWQGPVETAVVPFDADAKVIERAATGLAEHPGGLLLLVVADGSARRGEKAPGHLDERAFDVDADILRGVAGAEPAVLLGIDIGLAGEVLAHGRAALQVLAKAVDPEPPLSGRLLWSGDPYGVLYLVAEWSRAG